MPFSQFLTFLFHLLQPLSAYMAFIRMSILKVTTVVLACVMSSKTVVCFGSQSDNAGAQLGDRDRAWWSYDRKCLNKDPQGSPGIMHAADFK